MKNKTMTGKHDLSPDPALVLMRYIIICSLLLSGIFAVGSWLWFDWHFAGSILVGSVLVNLSFYLLQRDIVQFVDRVAEENGVDAIQGVEKVKFMLKFYARLIVLGLLVFVLVAKVNINMIGLIIGLSIVVLSIVIVCVVKGKQIYSSQKLEGV